MSIQIDGVEYLTCRETAAALGLHPGTLRNWRADGRERLKSVKLDHSAVGHSVLYRKVDVDAYVALRA